MNKARRKQIESASALLNRALEILNQVIDDEQDALDNYPESLQETDKYLEGERAVDMLECAVNGLDEVIDYTEKATLPTA